jgi:septal ring factor EnvC (AmiA/AmiB activator)
MDQILKQVRRARRRLWLELLLSRLIRCWFVTLLIALAAIAAPRIVTIAGLPPQWTAWCLGGAIGGGLLIALASTFVRGRTELDASMEIDRRFGLKERIASSLSLPPDAADTPAGRALLNDARRAIGRLEISERFRIRLGRAAWLPLVPAVLAAMVAALVDAKPAQSSSEPSGQVTKQAIENTTKSLRKKLEEPKKLAQKQGLKEAEELLTKMDKGLEQLAAKKQLDKKQTLVKLNDLAKQLEERQEKLGGNQELKKQLAGMKDFSKGPADKMMEAMKQGDWEKAKQELAKLQDQLKTGKLDEAAKKDMANQMDELKQKLEQAAAERKQTMEDLKKQIQEQKNKGNLAEAGQLQQKLDQLQKQQQQGQKLGQLAKQLAQAQQALQQGDKAAASQAMQQMIEQLEQMQKDGQESEMLQTAMDQLEMAKNAMDCQECMGQGCGTCNGEGLGNLRSNRFSEKGGNGMGAGRGFGPRPDEKNDVAFRDSQVKQRPGKGAMVVTGEADGPNIRGNVRQSIAEEMAAQASQPADPMVIEQLPKAQRENAEDYFNRLRDGE